ncbi:MAG: hypothetical protein R3C10_00485 [Pirellulales bacterium]
MRYRKKINAFWQEIHKRDKVPTVAQRLAELPGENSLVIAPMGENLWPHRGPNVPAWQAVAAR